MVMQGAGNTPEYQKTVVRNTPTYKLYSTRSVVIATFFGTPLAGGYLMAKNYQRLGNRSYARLALFYTMLIVIASYFLGFVLPESVPSMTVTLPVVIMIGQAMKKLQGKSLEQHLQSHGKFESCWKAWGISLLIMAVVLLIIVACAGLIAPDF